MTTFSTPLTFLTSVLREIPGHAGAVKRMETLIIRESGGVQILSVSVALTCVSAVKSMLTGRQSVKVRGGAEEEKLAEDRHTSQSAPKKCRTEDGL